MGPFEWMVENIDLVIRVWAGVMTITLVLIAKMIIGYIKEWRKKR